jgi:hypothetical protein
VQLYEAAVNKTTGAAAGPIATFVAGSAAKPDIREIGIFVATGGSSIQVGLGRPAAAGVGAATGTLGQALDPNDPAATSTLASSFATTQPTAPTNFMRRIDLPNATGAGIMWVWGYNEMSVASSANLVIWQISALAVTYDIYIKFEE